MDTLGRYSNLERLGEGRFGEVYKARDNLGRTVALKLLKRQWAMDRESLERMRREAQAAGSLFHARIATILGFEEENGQAFLVMRYIHGPTLGEKLKKQGALPWAEALEVTRQVAEGLDYAHKSGFIHRDIKPSNILLGAAEGAVLTDFGLVKAAEGSGGTSTGVTMGTPHYIPPEVWGGKAATAAVDVYALACVVYEMLTGEILFAGESTPHIMSCHFQGPRFPQQWPRGVPAGVEVVLHKALALEPGERYPRAGELVKALEQAGLGRAALPGLPAEEVAALRKQLKEAIRAGEWAQAKTAAQKLLEALPGDQDAQGGLEVAKEELDLLAGEEARRLQAEGERQRKAQQARLEKLKQEAEAALAAWETDKAMKLALEWLAEEPASPQARALRGKVRQAEQDKPKWAAEQRARREAEERERQAAEEKKRQEEQAEKKRIKEVDGLPESMAWLDALLPLPQPQEQAQRAGSPARIQLAEGVYMEMARVPAGEFLMGSEKGSDDEKPQRKVYLDEYWIGTSPVTNAQFRAFVRASGYKTSAEKEGSAYGWTGSEWKEIQGANWEHPRGPGSDVRSKEDHPVVSVSWEDALAFCKWASQASGRQVRLPSEAEWEKAARGTDGRTYPWGKTEPNSSLANYGMKVKDTTPVGRYSPAGDSPYGCADMAGNVWEWCADWYDSGYYKNAPNRNPQGPSSGIWRVVRGGSWFLYEGWLRASLRAVWSPGNRGNYLGFRCVA